jgi:formylmethanofuran dehydrogenase subunit B
MLNISKIICENCGKECSIDLKQSNKNWKVYRINEACECGHKKYIPFFEEKKRKIKK